MKHSWQKFSVGLVAAVVAVLAAEGTWIGIERRQLVAGESRLRSLLRQRDEYVAQTPAVTEANERSLIADVERLRQETVVLQARLFSKSGGDSGRIAEAGRLNTFFELSALAARLRATATTAGVGVSPDEHFGFGSYGTEGPPVALEAAVRRQAAATEAVLGCLFSARPRALLSVKREAMEPAAKTGDRRPEDYFAFASGLSLRSPEHRETVPLRVEFSGGTPALRQFLLGLAASPEVLAVRSIDAVPVESGATAKAPARGAAGGALAKPMVSRFAVVVEAVEAPGPANKEP